MADYIPSGDTAFDAWLENFVTTVTANAVALGLKEADLDGVTAARTAWLPAFAAHIAAQASAEGARQAKDQARAAVEGAVRPLVRVLQASAEVSDAERAQLGITVPDREPTPVGAPTTRPVATVDARQRLRHTVGFADEGTPTRKAKPAGVAGAEIWVSITNAGEPAPGDPEQYTFLALDTRTPYVAEFDAAEAGRTAHYILRWVSSRGERGPWSATASATIGA